jgi:hypothetical protein
MEGRADGWCVQPDPCHGASAPRAVAGSRVRVLQSERNAIRTARRNEKCRPTRAALSDFSLR